MAISKEDILEYISGLSVLELSELVKEFEEKFSITATPITIDIKKINPNEELFDVILKYAGTKRSNVIKAIQSITKITEAEAESFVETEKSVIQKGVNFEVAEATIKLLSALGATAEKQKQK